MSEKHWLASYPAHVPAEIDPDAYPSVLALLEEAMTRYAERPAFRCFGQTLTYREVDRLSRDFAAFLQGGLGVARGDRVAVMLPNVPAFPISLIGIVRAGAVQVNVNPLYTARELKDQLADAGAETIVIFGGVSAALAEIVGQTPVRNVVTVGLADGTGAALPSPPPDPRLEGAVGFAEALARGAALPFAPVALTGDDLLFLQYTGGTTGQAKGAALSHRNLVANTEQFKAFLPEMTRPGEEVVLTALPLYHVFALMVNFLTYFSLGAENWLVPNPRDPEAFVDTFAAAKPSVFTGVNTMFGGLVQHPRFRALDFAALRVSIGGGATILPITSERWEAVTGRPILEGYGLSETSPVLTLNRPGGGFSATVGLPFPSTDIVLLDETGRAVPLGEAGEVCVKGPQVMAGYWQKPEANATAFTGDGWFRTGDIGIFDAAGQLKIVDRKKDMISVSGFNVYPNEVEAVAAACAGVAECACVGAPDEKTGEAVRLFVVRAPDTELCAADLIAHCRKGLAAYKVPKEVAFLDALPKSTVGKILRRDLRGRP
ncbi:long-chain acyl-CoA synthetase [Tistlia consotensis]|uniref:Long-chain-fatty-acid--CoA ligase n=1 Tax=Tistlia consotensis USBA 355 TaxID=560819 RepID=A0A1Y6CKP2_9PROT|nr:AMP-binding protein [Tistlia consotensis]SMF69775.1 long-chain acyl-CoA synthetase [Tistlia consotensis USBA 355]SNS05352.1 long-chain acyl-CoA synthetase [Tistlia consotensis]